MMRMLSSMVLVSLVVILWAGHTHAGADKEALPIIEVEKPTHDFGRARQGEVVKHDFRVFNRGTAPLDIKSIKPGWGCSVARFDRTIPPGGEGKITLEVRTKGFQGKLQKTARVFTNDPKSAQVIIGLKGEVWAPISVNPRYARLTGVVGDKVEQVVHLRGEKKEPLIVKLDSVSIPDKVEVQLKETKKGHSYELKVKNKVRTQGTYMGQVKLTTNYQEKSEIAIRISGNIRPPLEVRPQALSFGRMSESRVQQSKKSGRFMTRSITVLLNKGNDLKIQKVESEKSLFKVVTKEEKPGRMVQLSVEPILEKLKQGSNADRLKIYTNQKQGELLVVPISFDILQADEDWQPSEEGGDWPPVDEDRQPSKEWEEKWKEWEEKWSDDNEKWQLPKEWGEVERPKDSTEQP